MEDYQLSYLSFLDYQVNSSLVSDYTSNFYNWWDFPHTWKFN